MCRYPPAILLKSLSILLILLLYPKVGVLIGDGFDDREVTNVLNLLKENGVFIVIVSETLGDVTGAGGTKLKVDKTFLTSEPLST